MYSLVILCHHTEKHRCSRYYFCVNSCVIRHLWFYEKKTNGCVSLTVNYSLKTKLIKNQFSVALIDTYSFVRD